MSGPSYSTRSRDREPELTREQKRERSLTRIIERNRTDQTRERYLERYTAMRELDEDPAEYCSKNKLGRSSYFQCRAAWQYGLAVEAREAYREKRYAYADKLFERLKASKPDYKREGWKVGREYEGPVRSAGRKYTGRKALRPLPMNWREVMQQHFPEKYQDAGMVTAITGCRPDELAKGIRVVARAKGLEVTIAGSKVNQGYGQESRTLTFALNTPLTRGLHRNALQNGGEMTVQAPTGAWAAAYRRASEKSLGVPLSPYKSRHQFCSDLKSAKSERDYKSKAYTTEQIARAMGHQSEKSQEQYGHANQGRTGGGSMSSVTSSTTPKPSTSTGNGPPRARSGGGPSPR